MYPRKILSYNQEYIRFFVKRFPFEIFNVLMRPHLEKERYEYILKEISEVVSVFNILNFLIKKYKIEKFTLYELASGDALFSHFVAKMFPESKIFAVDLKFSEEYVNGRNSKFLNNLFFIEQDFTKSNKLIEEPDFIVSIHACTELSEKVIDLASFSSTFFILVPCCIGSEKYKQWLSKYENKLLLKFLNLIGDEYYRWCYYLAKYAEEKGFEVNVKKDNKMLSKRNLIIFGKIETIKK